MPIRESMSRKVSLAVVLLLLVPHAVSADPLVGKWRSDRELTLARLEADKVAPQHRRTILEEGEFGNAVVEFGNGKYSWALGEKKWRLPYRIRSIDGNYVEIEYFRTPAQTTPDRMRLFVTDKLLYVPIKEFGFYEVFTRVSPPASPTE